MRKMSEMEERWGELMWEVPGEVEKTQYRCRAALSSRVPVALRGEPDKDLNEDCFAAGIGS